LAPRPDLAGSPSLELVRTRVSAILVSYNSGGALLRCLATIGDDVDEIVIVNNGDWGPELDVAAARGGVTIVAAYDNAGFAAGADGRAPREIASPSGAAMVVRRDEFLRIGGFREELFLYHEDQDLGWRMRMAGRRIVLNPGADIYHEHEFDRHERKRYYLERN